MIRAIWKTAPANTEQGAIDVPVAAAVVVGLGALLLLYLLLRAVRHRSAPGPAGVPPAGGRGLANKQPCRWRRDRRRHRQAAMMRWVCAECGVDGFTIDGKPPKLCKRNLRDTGL